MIGKEELMIGNIVKTHEGGLVRRVVAIGEDYVLLDGDMKVRGYDQICPIRVEPSILQKNGFTWDGMYARYYEGTMEVEYYKHEGILRRWYIHKDGTRELVACSCLGIFLLHEFQNWFTINGIEKQLTY